MDAKRGFKKKLASGLGGTVAAAVRHGRDFLARPVTKDPAPTLREKLTELAASHEKLATRWGRAFDSLMKAWAPGTPEHAAVQKTGRQDLWFPIALLISERNAALAEVERLRMALQIERDAAGPFEVKVQVEYKEAKKA